MTRTSLKQRLKGEIDRWSRMSPDHLRQLKYPITEQHGATGEEGFYQVEVGLLENRAEYLHLSLAVDDGGLTAFVPVTGDFIVHADGRVDLPP